MPPKQLPEPWASFLSHVDDQLRENVELHCFGGFVVTMLYGLARSTADVDVLPATKRSAWRRLSNLAGKGSELHRKHGIYLDFVTYVLGKFFLPECVRIPWNDRLSFSAETPRNAETPHFIELIA